MNSGHFRTILWLRWRLAVAVIKRGGTIGTFMLGLLCVAGVVTATAAFLGGLVGGIMLLRQARTEFVLLVWDGIVGAFLFIWLMGLLTELQRSDSLSLYKLLHLPISLQQAFLLNYLSSLVTPSLFVFIPGMVGFGIASVIVKGAGQLLLFPLIGGLVFCITAVTFQFRGWLAAMMTNKRKRRMIVSMITMVVIVGCQLPNLINMTFFHQRANRVRQEKVDEMMKNAALQADFAAGRITAKQLENGLNRMAEKKQIDEGRAEATAMTFLLPANQILPVGWLPYGAMRLGEGRPLPAVLGFAGLFLIGAGSLKRSYGTTVRFYRGDTGSRARTVAKIVPAGTPTNGLIAPMRGIEDRAAAVAATTWFNLMRAPELKMQLLTPFIVLIVFGSVFFTNTGTMPEFLQPLLLQGAVGLAIFSTQPLIQNQFGFDRNGFRLLVLSPVPRWRILFGKNIACASITMGIAVIALLVIKLGSSVRFEDYLAAHLQLASVYLMACLIGNMVSILAPSPVAVGVKRRAQVNWRTVVIHLISLPCLTLVIAVSCLPVGLGTLYHYWPGVPNLPVNLVLSALMLTGSVFIYRYGLRIQGGILQEREKGILERVAVKVD